MKLHRVRQVETFEDSIEATKYVSKAIFGGVLDDFGPFAEIEATAIVYDDEGRVSGVQLEISSPESAWKNVQEGVAKYGEMTREIVRDGSNVRVLRPMQNSWVKSGEVVVQRFSLGAC